MLKLIGLIVILQCQLLAFGQDHQNSPGKHTVDVTTLPGTYHYKAASFELNKNQTCKIVFTAPEKLIYEGVWELQNDTIVCTYRHISFTLEGIEEDLQEHPISQKFILSGNTLYQIEGDRTGVIAFNKGQ
jgi:hypothetical protein